jgi:hypothetical protein
MNSKANRASATCGSRPGRDLIRANDPARQNFPNLQPVSTKLASAAIIYM